MSTQYTQLLWTFLLINRGKRTRRRLAYLDHVTLSDRESIYYDSPFPLFLGGGQLRVDKELSCTYKPVHFLEKTILQVPAKCSISNLEQCSISYARLPSVMATRQQYQGASLQDEL